MASDSTQICNMALARVGVKQFITDVATDPGVEAATCRVFFADIVERVLAAYTWPFAKGRGSLAASSTMTRTNWAFVYPLPADCVAPRAIVQPGNRTPISLQQIPYATEASDDRQTRVLLCDMKAAELIYTSRNVPPGSFPASFASTVAWLLASELAPALTVQLNFAKFATDNYQVALSEAIAEAAREEHEDQTPDSEFIQVRR